MFFMHKILQLIDVKEITLYWARWQRKKGQKGLFKIPIDCGILKTNLSMSSLPTGGEIM